MAHPSSPTRHLVERKSPSKKVSAPTAHCPANGLGDSEFAGATHIGASYADIINKFTTVLSDLTWPKSSIPHL